MNFLERQLEDPVRFARIKRIFYICLGVFVLAEVLAWILHLIHPHFDFEEIPAQIREGLRFVWIERVEDALRAALTPAPRRSRRSN